MKIKNTNITINVADIERSISFYTSIGFMLKNRWDNHYAQLVAPGVVIGLHPGSANIPQNTGNMSIGFTTDNFEETKKEMKQIGINITERSEEGGEFLHFNDPDGTSLYFINPKW